MCFGANLNKVFSLIRGVLVGLVFAFVGWKLFSVAHQSGSARTGTWLSGAMPMLVVGIWVIVALAALLRRSGRRVTPHEQQADLSPMMYEPPADLAAPPDIPAPPNIPAPPADPNC
jgi:hypothetical protein